MSTPQAPRPRFQGQPNEIYFMKDPMVSVYLPLIASVSLQHDNIVAYNFQPQTTCKGNIQFSVTITTKGGDDQSESC